MAKNEAVENNPNVFARFGKWCVRVGKKFGQYCKEVASEVKRLTWPSKKELISYSLAVICFCGIMAIIIGLLDFGFGTGFDALAKLGN